MKKRRIGLLVVAVMVVFCMSSVLLNVFAEDYKLDLSGKLYELFKL